MEGKAKEYNQERWVEVMKVVTDYKKYRGKCKELSEDACKTDPTLTLVRGYYYCPMWNTDEAHWWTIRMDGTIYDPSVKQFPSNGLGIYTPFDGMITCEECGETVAEEDSVPMGNYMTCSLLCAKRLVGL